MANAAEPELGTAQPQLVFLFFLGGGVGQNTYYHLTSQQFHCKMVPCEECSTWHCTVQTAVIQMHQTNSFLNFIFSCIFALYLAVKSALTKGVEIVPAHECRTCPPATIQYTVLQHCTIWVENLLSCIFIFSCIHTLILNQCLTMLNSAMCSRAYHH